jgi:hypothetical protein
LVVVTAMFSLRGWQAPYRPTIALECCLGVVVVMAPHVRQWIVLDGARGHIPLHLCTYGRNDTLHTHTQPRTQHTHTCTRLHFRSLMVPPCLTRHTCMGATHSQVHMHTVILNQAHTRKLALILPPVLRVHIGVGLVAMV